MSLRVRNLDGVVLSEEPHPVTIGVCADCGKLLGKNYMKPCKGLHNHPCKDGHFLCPSCYTKDVLNEGLCNGCVGLKNSEGFRGIRECFRCGEPNQAELLKICVVCGESICEKCITKVAVGYICETCYPMHSTEMKTIRDTCSKDKKICTTCLMPLCEYRSAYPKQVSILVSRRGYDWISHQGSVGSFSLEDKEDGRWSWLLQGNPPKAVCFVSGRRVHRRLIKYIHRMNADIVEYDANMNVIKNTKPQIIIEFGAILYSFKK